MSSLSRIPYFNALRTKKGFTLPGHNYLGPGNNIFDPDLPVGPNNRKEWDLPPTNKADELARQHDLEYSRAKTVEDVQEADAKFLHAAKGLPSSFQRSVALAGIGTKSYFEKHFGVKYPGNLPSRASLTGNVFQT